MRKDLSYYEVTPSIVPADTTTTVTIRPRFEHAAFQPGQTYEVQHLQMEDSRRRPNSPVAGTHQVQPEPDGTLRLEIHCEGEQEHVLCGLRTHNTTPWGAGDERLPVELHLYSLRPDLLARRPWKGDFHLHSNRSDGVEAPAYVAGACRRIGLDFMALSDHHVYQPSLEAIAAYREVPHDLGIFPGEEVHPPRNGVHLLNFGGRFSINGLFTEPAYEAEVAARQAALPPLGAALDPYQVASCAWCFDKIREAGGLAVFVHPYWTFGNHYSLPEALIEYLFEHGGFDAFEVVGGMTRAEQDSNLLQIARYHEEATRGRRYPVVGLTDSHGCERDEWWGWGHTVVFAPTGDFEALRDSIREDWSVAVQTLPGELARPVGSFRLVKYVLFLLREVFPRHDELCLEEGREMLRYAAGEADAAVNLARLAGRCAALYDRIWA